MSRTTQMAKAGLGVVRRVVKREFKRTKLGDGRMLHYLECGHVVEARASLGIPSTKLCKKCQ